MAKIGLKCLTYAPFTSGGEYTSITYGTGVMLNDYMIRADVGEERVDVDFYADDHKIDTENSMTGATLRRLVSKRSCFHQPDSRVLEQVL